MSWSRAAPWCERTRRAGVLAAAAVLLLSLAACGFSPLHGRGGPDGIGTEDYLATVHIAPMPDRVGQELHNLLRDRINPKGQPLAPIYNLQVQVSSVIEELGIRKDRTATRANLTVFANFTLTEAATNRQLLTGRSRAFSSYNILESQFATLFSEQDAGGRALREISDDIRNRLAVYFARVAQRPS